MKLSADQVERIRSVVDNSGIRIEALRDDVLDHLCCVVELALTEEKSFDESLERAVAELAPDGLHELEKETVYLLNSTKIVLMKKIMYSIGFLGAFALTMGVTFKWLHWPGGDELFMIGFLVLTLLYAPLAAIDRYKVSISKAISEKLRITIGLVSAMSIGVGGLLKVMGLYGGDFLLLGGSVVFAIAFYHFISSRYINSLSPNVLTCSS